MLHKYSATNFQSFKDKAEVSLVLNQKTSSSALSAQCVTGERVSKVTALIGANASGKTALLKSIAFLSFFMNFSFIHLRPDEIIPLAPHFSTPTLPTSIQVEFDFQGDLYRYELIATQQRVLHEALYIKRVRFNYVFIRDWDEATHKYEIKQKDFGMLQSEANKVRQNASLIATAAQYDVPLAKKLATINLTTNVSAFGRRIMDGNEIQQAAHFYSLNSQQMDKMNGLLRHWDFGLSKLRIAKETHTNEKNQSLVQYKVFGVHTLNNTDVELNIYEESSGTQGAFVLLAKLLPVLEKGGIAIIDEIENDLHPHMLEPIIDLFASAETNPYNAQLLFTCHAIEILNLLNKSQVILVEKDTLCESAAWRLDSMEGVRSDDNLYAKYMAGAYGAVPQL